MKKIQIGAIFTAMRESFADKKKRAGAIYRILSKTYPDVKCELDFKNPLQLLVATVLSAQCTDKRVNAVTPALFKKFKSVKTFAGADMRELQNGWTKETDPVKVEFAVMELIPRKEWTNLSQRLIWHGRRVCHSRKPACAACPLAKLCPSYGIGEMDLVKAKSMVKSDKDFR